LNPTAERLDSGLAALFRALPPVRRRQVVTTSAIMLIGGLAEILSIGSLIPFLSALTNPGALAAMPVAGPLLMSLGGPDNLVATAATIFLLLMVVSGAIRLWLVWASQRLAFDVGYDLSVIAFVKLLSQPYDFYARTNSSELLSRFEKVQQLTYSSLLVGIQALVSTITALLLLAFMMVLSPSIALGAGAVLILTYVVTSIVVRRRLQRNSAMIGAAWANRVEAVQVALGGIRDIILDRSHRVFADQFRANAERLRHGQSVNAFISSAPRALIETVAMVLVVAIAWWMARWPGGLLAALPILGALALAAQRLLPMLQASYLGWSNFLGNSTLVREVVDLISLPDTTLEPAADNPPFARDIAFDRVDFAYPGHPAVLHGISFVIRKGERIGIVGTTGSGKSTLMDLLLGLHRPTSGAVTIDGRELDRPRSLWWQAQIAHVPQHIFLADDSVARNIAFGVPGADIDMGRVAEAARMAGIHDFIAALPEGYETRTGERGARLSGGQRQRLGIARALYKRATVVVLDEATSALDMATERGVMDSIDNLSKDITVIMIAHRLDSLKRCDRILKLEEGRLVEVVERGGSAANSG
jgi:ATP-binding cassette, subfamily B, bacterial PglK